MRRKDREISYSEAIEILRKGEFGVLSMCTSNNEGYGIPLTFVLNNNEIYLHCSIEGSKLDYLRNNNKVSFCVVGKTEVLPSKFGALYESVIVSGFTSEIEGTEKHDALILIVKKYSGDYIQEGKEYIINLYDKVRVIKLTIGSITGKARK